MNGKGGGDMKKGPILISMDFAEKDADIRAWIP